MPDITGRPGELIERLIALLDSEALGERGWDEVGAYTVGALGGTVLYCVVPDTGVQPAPGTVGEWMRQHGQLVSRERYFELIQARLGELVMEGLEEAFLVRSLRDEIRR